MPVVHRTSILTATPITASPKDQIVTRDARRIVSLLPGATEWVCELGLASRLVGVSHECDYPPQVNSLPRVTRSRINSQQSGSEIDAAVRQHSETRTPLYDLDVDTLARLKPDLILTLTANPDILLIACCGMGADRTRTELSLLERVEGWSQLRCVKSEHVHAFDGSAYFNRPGPRLIDALEAVAELIRQWQSDQAGQG